MYTSFFNFKCKPFQLSPDPEFLFMSRVHKRAMTYLNYGIRENAAFILMTGEIGTGKTTILRSMLKEIPQDLKLARIYNTKVNSEQLISMIAEEFGVPASGDDKKQMLSKLTDFFVKQYAEGKRSMLIIDEAQNLSPDLLEEIRLLSNLETDKSKLLQIVLVGQPELNMKLSRPELEQLRQRIAISAHISPLDFDDTEAYIKHRLKVAGNKENKIFEDDTIEVIYDFSKGTPRLINIICDFALLSAFTDSRKTVDRELIREIAADLINESPQARVVSVRKNETPSPDSYEKIKKVLSSINVRLQNLEASFSDLQDTRKYFDETVRLIITRETELNELEKELLRREYELQQKGELFEGANRTIISKEEELSRREQEIFRKEFEIRDKEGHFNKS